MTKENVITASIEQQDFTEAALGLFKQAADKRKEVALEAQRTIAGEFTEALRDNTVNFSTAVSQPVREGVVDGDITSNIFFEEDFSMTSGDMRIELDLLAPGTEKEHVAYVMPEHGKIPERRVESDYIHLTAYPITSAIDCTRRYFRNTRFDVLRRMLEVLRAGFVKKNNDDGWRTLINAAAGRNIVAYDPHAAAGQFTPKLVSVIRTAMRRNGSGNSTSLNRRRATDLYMSPEAMEDMTAWGLNLVPDQIRTMIHMSEDGALTGMFGLTFHDLDELGVGQEYQNYYSNTVGGSLGPSGDQELVVALDLTRRDKAFIRPKVEDVEIFEDDTLHRRGLVGFYGHEEGGWAVLDYRYVLAASF